MTVINVASTQINQPMQTVKVDVAASADLIAAVTGKQIVVTGVFLQNTTVATTLKFQSGGSTDLTGTMTGAQSAFVWGDGTGPVLATNVGEKLNLVLGNTTQVSGTITYYTV